MVKSLCYHNLILSGIQKSQTMIPAPVQQPNGKYEQIYQFYSVKDMRYNVYPLKGPYGECLSLDDIRNDFEVKIHYDNEALTWKIRSIEKRGWVVDKIIKAINKKLGPKYVQAPPNFFNASRVPQMGRQPLPPRQNGYNYYNNFPPPPMYQPQQAIIINPQFNNSPTSFKKQTNGQVPSYISLPQSRSERLEEQKKVTMAYKQQIVTEEIPIEGVITDLCLKAKLDSFKDYIKFTFTKGIRSVFLRVLHNGQQKQFPLPQFQFPSNSTILCCEVCGPRYSVDIFKHKFRENFTRDDIRYVDEVKSFAQHGKIQVRTHNKTVVYWLEKEEAEKINRVGYSNIEKIFKQERMREGQALRLGIVNSQEAFNNTGVDLPKQFILEGVDLDKMEKIAMRFDKWLNEEAPFNFKISQFSPERAQIAFNMRTIQLEKQEFLFQLDKSEMVIGKDFANINSLLEIGVTQVTLLVDGNCVMPDQVAVNCFGLEVRAPIDIMERAFFKLLVWGSRKYEHEQAFDFKEFGKKHRFVPQKDDKLLCQEIREDENERYSTISLSSDGTDMNQFGERIEEKFVFDPEENYQGYSLDLSELQIQADTTVDTEGLDILNHLQARLHSEILNPLENQPQMLSESTATQKLGDEEQKLSKSDVDDPEIDS